MKKIFSLLAAVLFAGSIAADCTLNELSVAGYTLTPEFAPDVFEYSITRAYEAANPVESDITTVKNDPNASVSSIQVQEGQITVSVEAGDDCITEYIIYIEVAPAEPKTIYCKMTQGWWTADGAAVAVHYWDDDDAGTVWPGIRMNAVADQEGTWSYDVPADITGLIFVRVKGTEDVADWGAKTGILTVPTDGKNLYTITSTEAVWGEPGVTGEWSVYGEQPDPEPITYTLGDIPEGWTVTADGEAVTVTDGTALIAEGSAVVLTPTETDKPRVKSVTVGPYVPALQTMDVRLIGMGTVIATIHYAEGETWEQAIANHPTENAGWRINGGRVYFDGQDTFILLSPNGYNDVSSSATISTSESVALVPMA